MEASLPLRNGWYAGAGCKQPDSIGLAEPDLRPEDGHKTAQQTKPRSEG